MIRGGGFDFGGWKLVEPACERQRVGRVETMVTWAEYVVRLPVVSTRVARSSRPGSTSFGKEVLTCWLNRLWKGTPSLVAVAGPLHEGGEHLPHVEAGGL